MESYTDHKKLFKKSWGKEEIKAEKNDENVE